MTIQEDSYWILEGDGDDQKIVAICTYCAKTSGEGWKWEGSVLGYGDYDLYCTRCKNVIYLREQNGQN